MWTYWEGEKMHCKPRLVLTLVALLAYEFLGGCAPKYTVTPPSPAGLESHVCYLAGDDLEAVSTLVVGPVGGVDHYHLPGREDRGAQRDDDGLV